MGDVSEKLLCYNKGCGVTFDPELNENGSCSYHPGEPYFHDAYKGWTCCKRKSTDFTEFLNFKGCTLGTHSSIKPVAPPKPKNDDVNVIEARFYQSTIAPKLVEEEIPLDTPLVPLKVTISTRFLQQLSSPSAEVEVVKDGEIPVGTPCQNTSCSATYSVGMNENCVHHPGTAVFHEGLKYWSCCKKITSDFSKFLEQAGCTTGRHLWFKKKEPINCRLDWHQTGTRVEISIFAKNYDPHKSEIRCSPVKLNIYIYFPEGEHVFEREYNLAGVVKVEESSVTMTPTKVEIKLSKGRAENWPDLSK
ncbi:hypothetical protein V9T40_012893 [Parthenolecanium corni]|uniref:Cysteine and histidine-rich domain-containing protein n=1 Tax=Parthenolecanium corni TaxID=536013 RepID=A0AAN9T851_9HEMI